MISNSHFHPPFPPFFRLFAGFNPSPDSIPPGSSPNPSTSCHPLPDPKTPLHSRSSFRRQRKPEPQRLPPSTGRDEAPTVRPPLRGESQLVTVVLAEDFGHLCGVLVAGAPLPRAEPLLPPEAPGTWGTRHAPPGPVTGATGRFKRQDQVTHGDAWPMVKRTVRWTCSGFEVQGLFEEWKRNVLDSVSTGPLVNWAPKGLARSLFHVVVTQWIYTVLGIIMEVENHGSHLFGIRKMVIHRARPFTSIIMIPSSAYAYSGPSFWT